MNAFLVRLSFVSAIAVSSAAAIVACSSSTTSTSSDTADSGPTTKPKDSGGTPVDSGPTATGACPECADTICQNQTASAACQSCISASMKQGGACLTPVAKACAAEPDCLNGDILCLVNCESAADGGVPADAGDSGAADQTCYAKAALKDCESCCDTNHSKGSDAYLNALATCICGK